MNRLCEFILKSRHFYKYLFSLIYAYELPVSLAATRWCVFHQLHKKRALNGLFIETAALARNN